MATQQLTVPDIGGAENVEVIEVCVKPGDTVDKDDSLIVLESDKASMEVPALRAGIVKAILLKVGDKVSEGSPMIELEMTGDAAEPAPPAPAPSPAAAPAPAPVPAAAPIPAPVPAAAPAPAPAAAARVETVYLPDLGTDSEVEVIEVGVTPGSELAEGDTMLVLESDKASMEVPAPRAGIVRAVSVKVGDKVRTGAAVLELESAGAAAAVTAPARQEPAAAPAAPAVAPISEPPRPAAPPPAVSTPAAGTEDQVYAGPAVRKLAREMGIDLVRVTGSGPRGRIQKDDVKQFVKELMEGRAPGRPAAAGAGIPPIPEVDFSQFGPVDIQPLTGIQKAIAANMQRNWLNVPHVTQWDDADITELEAFRATLKKEADARGARLSPIPFLLKACAAALKAHPKFCASLHADGERLVYKQYIHIGMAVDTPAGLLVPVLRDVDRKSIWELAAEAAELAQKARDRKLKPTEMQGGCFSVSSLGNIGGLGFTPIVNAPEVAILGVSNLTVKPVWNGTAFEPRKMLPLSLSYDHRVINGGDAGRFMATLTALLGDIRRLVL